MKESTRKILGASMALLAIIALVVLWLAGLPLVTMSSEHFAGTGAMSYHIRLHWPLVVSCVAFIVGLVLLLVPRRGRAA